MQYTVVLEKQKEGGYTGQCLEIPAAISQGGTETLSNVKEALELVLEVMKEEARGKKVVKVNV